MGLSDHSFDLSEFFFFRHSETVHQADSCQCIFPQRAQRHSFSSRLLPAFIVCRFVMVVVVTGGIYFPLSFSLAFRQEFRSLVSILFCCRSLSFFFFLNEGQDTLTWTIEFLKVRCAWRYFSNTHPRTFPEGLCH